MRVVLPPEGDVLDVRVLELQVGLGARGGQLGESGHHLVEGGGAVVLGSGEDMYITPVSKNISSF